MWTAGPSPRYLAVTPDVRCAGCRGGHSAHYLDHDHDPRTAADYGAREDRAKGAVTIESSASAALLRQRATCRTTWKSRPGRSKCARCSSPASRLGAATDAEIAVAP